MGYLELARKIRESVRNDQDSNRGENILMDKGIRNRPECAIIVDVVCCRVGAYVKVSAKKIGNQQCACAGKNADKTSHVSVHDNAAAHVIRKILFVEQSRFNE